MWAAHPFKTVPFRPSVQGEGGRCSKNGLHFIPCSSNGLPSKGAEVAFVHQIRNTEADSAGWGVGAFCAKANARSPGNARRTKAPHSVGLLLVVNPSIDPFRVGYLHRQNPFPFQTALWGVMKQGCLVKLSRGICCVGMLGVSWAAVRIVESRGAKRDGGGTFSSAGGD